MKRILAVALLAMLAATSVRAQGSLDAERVYLWSGGASRLNVATGSGAPSGGITADTYVDFDTGEWYTRRASGTWTLFVRAEDTNTFTVLQTFNGGISATALTLTTTALTVPNGGTGNATWPIGGLVYAPGATSLAGLTAVGSGQVLTSTGLLSSPAWSADPTLTSLTLGTSGILHGGTNTIELYNGTSAQRQNWFNTRASGADCEYAYAWWNANLFRLGTSTCAAGTKRDVAIAPGDVTAATFAAADNSTTFAGQVNVAAALYPTANINSPLGDSALKWKYVSAAELHVGTIVSQATVATIGGRIIVAPSNFLTADLAPGGTTITVKYNNFANGARIYFENAGSLEWMAVTSGAGGSAGVYTYSVTRNLDGSGANQWYSGDAAVNTGTTGAGLIDLYSTLGVLGTGTGPTIVGNVRTGTAYNAIAPRWAAGNLNGTYGYVADTYGFAAGDAAATNVTVDATNGFRVRSGTTDKLKADASGDLSLSSGNVTINSGGISILPAIGVPGYAPATAYDFTVPSGAQLGMGGYSNVAGTRELYLYNKSNATSIGSYITVFAQGDSGNFDDISRIVMSSLPGGSLSELQLAARAGLLEFNTLRMIGRTTALTTATLYGTMNITDGAGTPTITTVQPGLIGTSSAHDFIVIAGNATKIKCFTGGGCTTGDTTDPGSTNFRVAGTLRVGGATTLVGTTTAAAINVSGTIASTAAAITMTNAVANFTISNGSTLETTLQPGYVGTDAGDLSILAGNAVKIVCYASGGCVVGNGSAGNPTGGDKGTGTLNASDVYDDGVKLTDWVFADYYDGAPSPTGRRLYTIDETRTVTAAERRLPWMPAADDFSVERALGRMITRIWQGQEQQQLFIFDLEKRIAALEGRAK